MSDLISRQAAISAICSACGKIDCDKMDKCEKLQLPPANCSEFPNNSDTISRQAVIDAMAELQGRASTKAELKGISKAWKRIKALPAVQPKRGRWLEDKGQQTLMKNFIERGEVWRVCSICGAGHMIGHKYAIDKAYHDRHHNFCPNCGADMR
jgi:hypothetical protein